MKKLGLTAWVVSLGRSSGNGAFSIWTHNMKGIEWHDSFAPRGAPADADRVSAVTLQAGEQWIGELIPSVSSVVKLELS